jgi:hypothetical protein
MDPAGLSGPRLSTPSAVAGGGRLHRPSRRTVLIFAAVLVLLVGGGVAYAVFKPPGPSGERSVQRYFEALSQGNTGRALALVADAERYTAAEYPLLHASVLAAKEARPSGVRIVETQTAQYGPQQTENVRVSYRLGGATVEQTIAATPRPDGRDHLLHGPFMSLEVTGAGGRAVTVNGVAVDTRVTVEKYAFPAVYTVAAEGNALIAGETRTAEVSGSRNPPVATVTFAPLALVSGAQAAVEDEAKRYLDRCVQSTEARPSGCPFRVYVSGENASVKWQIVTYPTVQLTPPSNTSGAQVRIRGSRGKVHYEATYTDYSGATETDSDDIDFSFSGTAKATGSTITLSIY